VTRLALAGALAALLARGALAVELTSREGELFAFPALEDDHGRVIADSNLRQWIDGDRLHVRIEHALEDGRHIVERTRFKQGRFLAQEWWSWEERRGGRLARRFEVDLDRGHATGRKAKEQGGEDRWDEDVKVEPGLTFVGTGVPYAVKNVRDRVVRGERIRLRAIVFLPKPMSLPILVKSGGRERIEIAGHAVDTDKVEVRPDLAGLEKIVELFKDPAGADVWLHHGRPPMLLRIRYPLLEVGDPAVRIVTLGRGPAPPRAGPAARRPGPH
jgi:hypothetical protein